MHEYWKPYLTDYCHFKTEAITCDVVTAEIWNMTGLCMRAWLYIYSCSAVNVMRIHSEDMYIHVMCGRAFSSGLQEHHRNEPSETKPRSRAAPCPSRSWLELSVCVSRDRGNRSRHVGPVKSVLFLLKLFIFSPNFCLLFYFSGLV